MKQEVRHTCALEGERFPAYSLHCGTPTMGDRTPTKGTPVSFMKSDSGVSSGSPVRSTFYGPNYGRNGKKDHYETPNPRRTYTIMSQVI